MGNVLAHHGQRACPCWADLLSDKCPKVNVVIPIFLFSGFSRLLQFLSAEFLTSDKSFHLTIHFISKPSRQLPDNRQAVNCLSVRILQSKTRQSDGFSHFWGNMTFEVNWGEIYTTIDGLSYYLKKANNHTSEKEPFHYPVQKYHN